VPLGVGSLLPDISSSELLQFTILEANGL
jgi:hypothetical protein